MWFLILKNDDVFLDLYQGHSCPSMYPWSNSGFPVAYTQRLGLGWNYVQVKVAKRNTCWWGKKHNTNFSLPEWNKSYSTAENLPVFYFWCWNIWTGIFNLSSSMAGNAIELSLQLLDGFRIHFIETFMVHRKGIIIKLASSSITVAFFLQNE